MPRTAKALQLPADVRMELDSKLRANAYSGLVELSEWLAVQGHHIGKSALGEYAQSLRRIDAEAGSVTAIIRQRGVGDDLGGEEANQLLLELGRLRFREAQILARLADIASPM